MTRMIQIAFSVPKEVHERLKFIARENMSSKAHIVRKIVSERVDYYVKDGYVKESGGQK
jgi:predicted DNA-binding protein